MLSISLLTIAYFIFVIVQCNPVSYFWLQFSGQVGKCFPATTFRPLFSSLKEKSVGGYYPSNTRSGHMRTATLGSRIHGESNNFRMSRVGSTKGYLRSVERKDARVDSFEDVMAMENLESKVEGGMHGEGSGHHYGDSDEEKGIMFSTTVEITRDLRKSRGDDMV